MNPAAAIAWWALVLIPIGFGVLAVLRISSAAKAPRLEDKES